MKRSELKSLALGLALAVAATLAACGGGQTGATTPAGGGGATKIPHSLEGRDVCTSCHALQTGAERKAQEMPKNHEGRTDDACQGCHTP